MNFGGWNFFALNLFKLRTQFTVGWTKYRIIVKSKSGSNNLSPEVLEIEKLGKDKIKDELATLGHPNAKGALRELATKLQDVRAADSVKKVQRDAMKASRTSIELATEELAKACEELNNVDLFNFQCMASEGPKTVEEKEKDSWSGDKRHGDIAAACCILVGALFVIFSYFFNKVKQ